jgi:hypothetical protein
MRAYSHARQSARTWLPTPALLCVLFAPACVHSSGVHETDANERDDDAKRQQLDHMKAVTRTWCEKCLRVGEVCARVT